MKKTGAGVVAYAGSLVDEKKYYVATTKVMTIFHISYTCGQKKNDYLSRRPNSSAMAWRLSMSDLRDEAPAFWRHSDSGRW